MRVFLSLLLAAGAAPSAPEPARLRSDAVALEQLVNENYAYLERLPQKRFSVTPKLRSELQSIATPRELVRYSERALMLLADHHAITGASLKDSWAVFPSYGDLWIERSGGHYVIEQVREDSPADEAGIRPGDRLVSIGAQPTSVAVTEFWRDLGTTGGGERDGYAARVLAAGRRDRPRALGIQDDSGHVRRLLLPSMYSEEQVDRPPLTATAAGETLVIRFQDSLGNVDTVEAFDAAMARAKPGQPILIDLTDTPGGGNTTVARGILGWFVTRPRGYQVHSLPVEERRTGIARQWVEQVLPRRGKHHSGPVTVRVGRWTGSMGEGLAIGFDAIGARVEGTRMAGLLGAVYDYPLPNSGIVLKLPTERLFTVGGEPRETFAPKPRRDRPR